MIHDYGWTPQRQQDFQSLEAQGFLPARVTAQHRGRYRLVTVTGECEGEAAGRLLFNAPQGGLPVTGDFVAVREAGDAFAIIHEVLARETCFERKEAGKGHGVQVIAANVDLALLVTALGGDFNLRRLERYIALAARAGAQAVIVLTKADLVPDHSTEVAVVRAISGGAEVHVVSVVKGVGLEALRGLLPSGRTAVVLGSSGAGKSTLVNALAGETLMVTQEVRASDERGKHTTTHRELLRLPWGAMILDTPGMRELGLTGGESGLTSAFADIGDLAEACRFRDCTHKREPGCAVRAAIDSGELDSARLEAFNKLQREHAYEMRATDHLARAAQKRIFVQRDKSYRARLKHGDKSWPDG